MTDYWTSRENSLEQIELSNSNKVSFAYRFPPVVIVIILDQ
jgi:hypothetical protein